MKKLCCFGRQFISEVFLLSFSISVSAQNISGRIVDEMTSDPVPGVLVQISATSLQEVSDADGRFEFELELPAETYIISFSKNGFLEKRFPIKTGGEAIELGTVYIQPDLLEVQQQSAVVTLAEHELDDEDGSYSNISGLLQASKDVFLNAAAFDFSPTFFRPRGYDSEFGKLIINGIEMNKFFSGRPQWSNWGGLNDVQRNQVFSMGTTPSEVSFGGPAGTTHITMRASQFGQGGKLSYAVANRAYTGRILASYHSGLQENGWAYSVALGRRFAEESYIEGSVYDANSFFVSVENQINPSHSLNFSAFYTPNRRGKNSPNTQEVHDLKGNRYNSYWGYQDGEIRNTRIREVEEPVFMLNHYWKASLRTSINSNIAYQFGKTGNSRIDYGGSRVIPTVEEDLIVGGGSNPDPAYYQKLPSFFLRSENTADYQAIYLAQKEFQDNGQVNWTSFYLANLTSTASGGNALYVLYEDRNDDRQITANTILRTEISQNISLNAAVNFRRMTSENFASVIDLLGGESFLDVDAFSEGSEAQNDLQNINRLVFENDIFKYHFQLNAMAAETFVQTQLNFRKFDAYAAINLSGTSYQRTGFFQNGNFPESSLGESEKPEFFNYGTKAGLTYKITGRHLLDLNVAQLSKPPALRNTFTNSRQNNELVKDIRSENIITADASYIFRLTKLTGRITGFYGQLQDCTEVSFYFADGLSGLGRDATTAFVQEVMTGVAKRHQGIEAGVESRLTSTLKLKTAASVGEFFYNANPQLYLTSDDFTEVQEMGKSQLKNYRIPGGPQRAAQIGFEYRDPAYWWISPTANFFSHSFVDVAPLTRTKNFFTDSDGLPIFSFDEEVAGQLLKQEQFDSYMLVNLVGGKSWKLKEKFVGVFGSLNNILDARYKTGGYEQSRNVNYSLLKADMEREQPLFAPKYWFGPGTTYYAHVYLRF